MEFLFLVFRGIFILISIVVVLVYLPAKIEKGSFIPRNLAAFDFCVPDDSHSEWCVTEAQSFID